MCIYLKTTVVIKHNNTYQAIRSLHNLFTVCNQMDSLTLQKIDLFDTLVLPILYYSRQLWGYIDADDIEKICP